MKVKIRHGIATWDRDLGNGKTANEVAFRGMIVDMPDDRAQYLMSLGAVVAPDVDLDRSGTIGKLSDAASNEEILAWAESATAAEVAAMAREKPDLAVRLRSAASEVKRRLDFQNELLGGHLKVAEKASEESGGIADPDELAQGLRTTGRTESGPLVGDDEALGIKLGTSEGADQLVKTDELGESPDGTDDDLTAETPDDVVLGTVKEVEAYLDEHPGDANAILEAEDRVAADQGRDPRAGVIRAAENAARHNAE
jgi:hypothetical protein